MRTKGLNHFSTAFPVRFQWLMLFFFAALAPPQEIIAQCKTFDKVLDLAYPTDSVFTDGGGILYYFSGKQLIRTDIASGNSFNFSLPQQEKNIKIDASNPLKIMLFLPELQQILWLDNTLTLINSLFINTPERGNALQVCNSFMGGFWVLDQQTGEVKRYTDRLAIQATTGTLYQWGLNTESILWMTERHGFLYVGEASGTILVFNTGGAWVTKIEKLNTGRIAIFENRIFYSTVAGIMAYDQKIKESFLHIPIKCFEDKKWIGFSGKQSLFMEKNSIVSYGGR